VSSHLELGGKVQLSFSISSANGGEGRIGSVAKGKERDSFGGSVSWKNPVAQNCGGLAARRRKTSRKQKRSKEGWIVAN